MPTLSSIGRILAALFISGQVENVCFAQQPALNFREAPGPRVVLVASGSDSSPNMRFVRAMRSEMSSRVPMTHLWILTERDMAIGLVRAKLHPEKALASSDSVLGKALVATIVVRVQINQTAAGIDAAIAVSLPIVAGMNERTVRGRIPDSFQPTAAISDALENTLNVARLAAQCALFARFGNYAGADSAIAEGFRIMPASLSVRICRLNVEVKRGTASGTILEMANEVLNIEPGNVAALRALQTIGRN